MNNELQMFNHPMFGELPVLIVDGLEWFGATEAAKALDFSNPHKAIDHHVEKEDCTVHTVGVQTGVKADGSPAMQKVRKKFINESGLYSLIFGASKQGNNPEIREKAKKFKRWVTSDVLPTIRKTGGYVSNDDLFINTYLPFADEQTKLLFKGTLETVRKQNELIQKQQKEIEYKEDVIITLVDKVTLAEKRQILNKVVRKAGRENISKRWSALYEQFEMKYHVDLDRRLTTYNKENKPKLKNKLDYIDKVMNKIPELYEIACKLYENDIEKLVQEIYKLNNK